MGWPSRELGDTPDLNSSKGAEPQEVGVAADDHLGFCSDGAFQNPHATVRPLTTSPAVSHLSGGTRRRPMRPSSNSQH